MRASRFSAGSVLCKSISDRYSYSLGVNNFAEGLHLHVFGYNAHRKLDVLRDGSIDPANIFAVPLLRGAAADVLFDAYGCFDKPVAGETAKHGQLCVSCCHYVPSQLHLARLIPR